MLSNKHHHHRQFRLVISGAVVAFCACLGASPAAAQFACDLNGAPASIMPSGTGTLWCGDLDGFLNTTGQTVVGVSTSAFAPGVTVVGSNAATDDVGGTAIGAFAVAGNSVSGATLPLPSTFSQTAVGYHSVAMGPGTVAIGDQAVAATLDLSNPSLVFYTPVANALAIGSHSLVTADSGTAIGTNALATAADSVALGAGSIADQANTVSVGTAGSERRIVNVSAGIAATDAVNVGQLNAATAGITADVTALETTTATHTTQIATLETTSATHTTQITSLQGNVTTLQTNVAANTVDIAALQTDLSVETAARIAADVGFDSRIDALEAIAGGLDERFEDIEDRSDVGTATAVALSGAMYMPGKTFNLTGNVGAYRGAIAGAIQFGAVVSDSIAVNAGVAKGFNKSGKTAARVGFTLGW